MRCERRLFFKEKMSNRSRVIESIPRVSWYFWSEFEPFSHPDKNRSPCCFFSNFFCCCAQATMYRVPGRKFRLKVALEIFAATAVQLCFFGSSGEFLSPASSFLWHCFQPCASRCRARREESKHFLWRKVDFLFFVRLNELSYVQKTLSFSALLHCEYIGGVCLSVSMPTHMSLPSRCHS
jgi:hypothetical protein